MNVGAAIEKDPDTFRELKRVVLMGGSIKRGYGDIGYGPPHGPEPEWNILNDIPSAQKLFAAGVPLFVMPLDSTQFPKLPNSTGSSVPATAAKSPSANYAPNAQVCLKSNPDEFFHFLGPRLAAP